MGRLDEVATGEGRLIEHEQEIGRAASCSFRLGQRYVSAHHAIVRWTGAHWELRDLGSRNGTWLNGERATPGRQYVLKRGDELSFGVPDQKWVLADDSAPAVMAVPLDGGAPVLVEAELLALPSGDEPQATLYKTTDGSWILERANESAVPIAHLQTFTVSGRTWRFSCTEETSKTSLFPASLGWEIRNLALSFFVSRDEEHVQLKATKGSEVIDLGARGHNYLLLTLARRRLMDAREGHEPTACGWVYQEDVEAGLAMTTSQFNIDVFRIRKHFASLNVVDPANIIERRSRIRQLRIGTGDLAISIV